MSMNARWLDKQLSTTDIAKLANVLHVLQIFPTFWPLFCQNLANLGREIARFLEKWTIARFLFNRCVKERFGLWQFSRRQYCRRFHCNSLTANDLQAVIKFVWCAKMLPTLPDCNRHFDYLFCRRFGQFCHKNWHAASKLLLICYHCEGVTA